MKDDERKAFIAAIRPGAKLAKSDGQYKVMAVADGWAMLRLPGCIPFTEHVKSMEQRGYRLEARP